MAPVKGQRETIKAFGRRLLRESAEAENAIRQAQRAVGIDGSVIFKTSGLMPPGEVVFLRNSLQRMELRDDYYIFSGVDMGFGSKVASPEESGLCIRCGRQVPEPGICKGCRAMIEAEAVRTQQAAAPRRGPFNQALNDYAREQFRANTSRDLDALMKQVYAAPMLDDIEREQIMAAAKARQQLEQRERAGTEITVKQLEMLKRGQERELQRAVDTIYGNGYYESAAPERQRNAVPKSAPAPKPKFVEKPRGRRIDLSE